jgi:Gas vesicle synthesis protein GvpL/GvpF
MGEQGASMDRVLYLFCLAKEGAPHHIGGPDEVFAIPWGGLMALCAWTSEDQWSGPQAERRMQDLQWLAPKVMHHEMVIEAAMRVSPVLPARLGTLFSSPRALERFFARHHAAVANFLAEVENKEEWAVKGVLDRIRTGQWLASTIERTQAGTPPSGGAGYLQARRTRAAAAKEVNHWVTQALEPIVEELRRYSTDSCQRPAGAVAGHPQTILNLAFLLAREKLPDFRLCVERANREHRGHGLELGMSGPWPPYSFCPILEMPA